MPHTTSLLPRRCRTTLLIATSLACVALAATTEPEPNTILQAIQSYENGVDSDADAETTLVGTLTQDLHPFFLGKEGRDLAAFLQDQTGALVISARSSDLKEDHYLAGDIVEVVGRLQKNPYGRDFEVHKIKQLGVAHLPAPEPSTVAEVCAGDRTNEVVTLNGMVEPIGDIAELSFHDDTGSLSIWLPHDDIPPAVMATLVEGGKAEITGFALPKVPNVTDFLSCGIAIRSYDDVQFAPKPSLMRALSVLGPAFALSLLLYWWLRHRSSEKRARELAVLSTELARARDAALDASRAKSEFLANMSHEIRTPLNGVIGLASVLKESELSPEEQREYADLIHTSGEALLTVLNDILDLSKIEAGQLDFEHRQFDVKEVVDNVVQIESHRAREKGIELEASVDPNIPQVMGDSGRLRQVLLNLVSNAVKFSERGTVRIDVRRRGSGDQRTSIRFSVSDQGIGIRREVQEKLFRPFTQADSSMSRKFGGTGLGLTISRKLVERMHGTIKVDSKPGAGSTFWFVVKLERAKPESGDPRSADALTLTGAHVEAPGDLAD